MEAKENFNVLRKYIEDSLKEIYNSLKICTNFTYKTLAIKYEEISNSSEAIDQEQNEKETDINPITKTSKSENSEFITVAEIQSLLKKAKFKYSFLKDKVKASVINQIRPGKVVFEISSLFGNCGENIQKVEVEFNNVSYITDLNF